MADIALLVAMNAERPALFPDASGTYSMGPHTIRVARSGMGGGNARAAAKKILTGPDRFTPDFILTLGFCGGTRDDLEIGDLILARQVRYRKRTIDLRHPTLDPAWEHVSRQGPEICPKLKPGTIQSFNSLVLSRRRVSAGTAAVDMEAFALAETAEDFGIPLVVIKAVSDMVPVKGSPASLFKFCLAIRKNAATAKSSLDRFMTAFLSSKPAG